MSGFGLPYRVPYRYGANFAAPTTGTAFSGSSLVFNAISLQVNDLVFVSWRYESGAAAISTVTDSAGNTYKVVGEFGTEPTVGVAYCRAKSAGSATVTITLSASRAYFYGGVATYSGGGLGPAQTLFAGKNGNPPGGVINTPGPGLVVASLGSYSSTGSWAPTTLGGVLVYGATYSGACHLIINAAGSWPIFTGNGAGNVNSLLVWFPAQTLRRRIWVPSAGGAASHSTTGALSADASTIAGTAAHFTLHATSGALSAAAATIAGTAAHQHVATGALAASSSTIAGTAAHLTLHATSGALSADAAQIAGTAAHQHATTGALVASDAAIAGTADHSVGGVFTTTGALAADAATIAGTAAHFVLHATTGALAADASTLAGTAAHFTLHASSGALSAQAAILAGAAAHEHAATGALSSDAAAITGTAEHTAPGVHTTSGDLQAADAALSGTAELQTSVRRSGPRPDKDVTRLWRTWQGMEMQARGALGAQPASMSGAAIRVPAELARVAQAAAPARAVPVLEARGELAAGAASMSGAAARYYRRDGLYRQAPRREVLTEKDARLLARLERVEAELAALRQSTTRTTP